MSRIWAVARHTIAEGIRMKIALVFVAMILLVLPALPFIIVGDGVTLKSRMQSFLTYSLGSVSFMLSLLTVFLACGCLAGEIQTKQIFMIASKPIPRWQFFTGKWVGIAVLNAALLLLTGVTVWGFAFLYLKNRPTFEADRAAMNNEVLSVRYGAKPDLPDFNSTVDQQLRQLREEGRLDEVSLSGRGNIRNEILANLMTAWRTLRPGEYRDYTFSNILVDREGEEMLSLHFRPQSPSGVDEVMFRARWQFGDPNDVNTLTEMKEAEFMVERFHSIPVPAWAVNGEGILRLRLQNASPRETIIFEKPEDFELLYNIGTFHWNLARALTIIWCRLAFLGALGLMASTFLSFPVACMVAFLTLLVAVTSGFLGESLDAAGVKFDGDDPLWIIGPVVRPLATLFVWLVPDFSKFDPVGTVVAGRVVPLIWTLQSLTSLVLLKGLVLGAIGCLIFTKRELAQVTT